MVCDGWGCIIEWQQTNTTSSLVSDSNWQNDCYLETRKRRVGKKRNSRFAEKGDYTLTKAAEEKYQAWLIHAQSRRIVLNKVRQAQVVNIHNKSLKSINKNCILLKVHLGDDASSLQLSAGDGKKYQLRLMQGVQPSDNIPAGLDQLPGETSFVESCRVMVYIYIYLLKFLLQNR